MSEIKNRYNKQRAVNGQALRFAKTPNPIPAQIKDADRYEAFFRIYKDSFVPFAGTEHYSSHSLLSFLLYLGELSPTHAACISKLTSFGFGGKVDIVNRLDPVYNLGSETGEVPIAQKQAFYDAIKLVKVFDPDGQALSLRGLAKQVYRWLKLCGNAYLELQRGNIAGVPFFSVVVKYPTEMLYLATPKGGQRFLASSMVWDVDYLSQHTPDILPLYPMWQAEEDGLERSIVHIKGGHNETPWYGRPDSISALLDMFFEFQNADQKSKATSTDFMGQVFIEVEDENPQFRGAEGDGMQQLKEDLESSHTNRSTEPDRILLTSRPYGSKPAFVFQFEPNTNENWYKTTGEQAEESIIKAHQMSKRLLGLDVSAGMNTSAYLDEFEILDATTVNEARENVGELVNNTILREALQHLGLQDLTQYSLQFTSPFAEMLKARKVEE